MTINQFIIDRFENPVLQNIFREKRCNVFKKYGKHIYGPFPDEVSILSGIPTFECFECGYKLIVLHWDR